jgi:hypothetical protein
MGALSSHPQGARIAYGVNAGLDTANYFNQQQQERQRREAGLAKLGDFINTEKFTTPKQLPADTQFSVPATTEPTPATGSSIPSTSNIAAPTNKAPVFTPELRQLMQAAITAGDYGGGMRLAQLAASGKNQRPIAVRPGASLLLPGETQPYYTAPAAPPAPYHVGTPESGVYEMTPGAVTPPRQVLEASPKATPPHYFNRDLGDKIVTGYIGDDGKEVITSSTPKNAAPARNMNPIEAANVQSLTAERTARTKRLQDLANTANDPKATGEKLTTGYSATLRDYQMADNRGDDAAILQLTPILENYRKRLATLSHEAATGGAHTADPLEPAGAPSAAPPGTILMQAPDGTQRAVPTDRVDEFKKKGATIVGNPVIQYDAQGNRIAKPLDSATAAAILKEAGGDKDKARQLARQRGYSF